MPSTVFVEENATLINEIGLLTLDSLGLIFLSNIKVYELRDP